MNRRTAIRQMATFLLTTASCAEPEQPQKVPRIGYLSLGLGIGSREERFRRSMKELGYIEGRTS
jgi:hypothetical protein